MAARPRRDVCLQAEPNSDAADALAIALCHAYSLDIRKMNEMKNALESVPMESSGTMEMSLTEEDIGGKQL